MEILISNSSSIPIYEQIKEQVKSAILNGEILEGEMLPSIRQLALNLKISVITTTRAYKDLEVEGFIYSVQGKGCFVSQRNSEYIREQKLKEIEEHISIAINSSKMIKLSNDEFREIINILLEENDKGGEK
ncbi:MAG: GntR family transcriptional regulator [Firmicutes bacterium]|nr:GntR family transcriptional regulator [Bacillota bacterium]MCL2255752.1 GntR family transcriptional regulator [Bacillota bacterium]